MKHIEYGYHYAYSETGRKERPPPKRLQIKQIIHNAAVGSKPHPTTIGELRGY